LETEWTPALQQWISQRALHTGFDAAAVSPVASPDPNHPTLDADRFAAWIEAGRAGEMDYLKRRDEHGLLLRSGVQVAIPWARSVIVCAMNYNSPAPLSIEPAPPATGWIARYAWSGRPNPAATNTLLPSDYHDELLRRLRLLEAHLTERTACQTRCYVDTGPLVERTAAAQAGIGWIGKNTCVLNQQLGSWFLLAVIVTSLPVAPEVSLQPAADRCGSCTRCIDACPTDALIAPRQMDASRCISYLTIEKKGTIPSELREPIGRQVFGCDICQDVCPWNRRAPIALNEGMQPRAELINPSLESLAALDNPSFKRLFKGSPLERTGKKRLHRNVAIAMGNSGDTQFLPRLAEWQQSEDPILAETASWAANRIRNHSQPLQNTMPAKDQADITLC
jgi:epoxyqueuosine reductase